MAKHAKCAALAGLALLSAPASAQQIDEQLWTTTTVDIPLSYKLSWGAHGVVRIGNESDGLDQIQIGTDLELDAGDVTLGSGYSYVTSYEDGMLTSREHRLRQQVGGELVSLGGGKLEGRLRLEQRWRDDGDDIMLRLRPRVEWTRPIGPGGLSLLLLHESFLRLNDTDWGGEARYERMRNQVALRRGLGHGLTAELGYLNQYDFVGNGPDEMVHALTVDITFGF